MKTAATLCHSTVHINNSVKDAYQFWLNIAKSFLSYYIDVQERSRGKLVLH